MEKMETTTILTINEIMRGYSGLNAQVRRALTEVADFWVKIDGQEAKTRYYGAQPVAFRHSVGWSVPSGATGTTISFFIPEKFRGIAFEQDVRNWWDYGKPDPFSRRKWHGEMQFYRPARDDER